MTVNDRTKSFAITKFDGAWSSAPDDLVVEEPLEIRLGFQRKGRPRQQSVSVTMRTPGQDFELALGFLYSEKILSEIDKVKEIVHCGDGENENVVRVELHEDVDVDLGKLQRHFYTTSSCGVCGKTSLEALTVTGYSPVDAQTSISAETLTALPNALRDAQQVFGSTGGLHAAGLFDTDGVLQIAFEDVGRHNALDKLIGYSWREGLLPLSDYVLVLSGRASFELMQKSLAAGLPIVAAVGAPSSLAVELAEEYGITLCGFVRDGRFNIYSHDWRLGASG